MLVIGWTARRIAAACCDYIHTRFPPGHDVPVCTIDQEWFADAAQKEIHAAQEADESPDVVVLGVADQLRARARYLRGIRAEAMAKQFERWAAELETAVQAGEAVPCG